MLFFAITAFAATAQTHAKDLCDFSYIPLNEPFSSPDYVYRRVPPQALSDDERSRFSKQLSDLRAVLKSDNLKATVLIGWSPLPTEFPRFTRRQVARGLRQKAESNKEKAAFAGAELSYLVDQSDPITLYLDLDYEVDGVPHKDVSVHIVARPSCELSIKLTGERSKTPESQYLKMKGDFELIREFVADPYGPVAYAQRMPRFSGASLAKEGIVLLCAVAYVLYGARLRIRQGRLTLVYAAVVAVLSVIAIATTVVFNEWFEEHATRLPYETIVYFVVILALHVWSYMSRTANAVAIAILYLVSAMVTRNLLVYLSVGTLPTTYLVLSGITGLAGVGVLALGGERKPALKPSFCTADAFLEFLDGEFDLVLPDAILANGQATTRRIQKLL